MITRRLPLLIALAFAVVAALVAIVVSRPSNHKEAAGLHQTQPVTVTGEGLPQLVTPGPDDPAVGQTLPTVRGKSFDGTAVTIAPDGHPKVIALVAHWCPHCQREVPVLVDWLRSHPQPASLELYAIATSTRSDLPNYPPSTWLKRVGWTAPVMADDSATTAANALGLRSFPMFVATDASGKVVVRTSGELTPDQLSALFGLATQSG